MQVSRTDELNAARGMAPPRSRERGAHAQETAREEKRGARCGGDTLALSPQAQERMRAEEGRLFPNLSELEKYLRQNYPILGSGAVSISKSYLRGCLEDRDQLRELEEKLRSIPEAMERIKEELPENTRLLSCTFAIGGEGNMQTQTASSSVTFNAAKRAAELASAMTVGEVAMVLGKLQKDLQDVKAGGCDERTIKQVKNMIRRAEEKLRRLREEGDFSGSDGAEAVAAALRALWDGATPSGANGASMSVPPAPAAQD